MRQGPEGNSERRGKLPNMTLIRKRVAYLAALLRQANNRLRGMRSLIQSISLPYERYLGALLRGSFIDERPKEVRGQWWACRILRSVLFM